jgi:hypothetical protein
MNKEKLFYKTLQDIFIGAKVEGQGGLESMPVEFDNLEVLWW